MEYAIAIGLIIAVGAFVVGAGIQAYRLNHKED